MIEDRRQMVEERTTRRQMVSVRTVSGLRTRYYPKSRIGQGMISMAPWVDIILLIIFFVIMDAKLVLQPGVIVELPTAPFTEGSHSGLIAVVLSVRGPEAGGRKEIVFFDDERFLVEDKEQMQGLKRAFAARVREHPDADLDVRADRRVSHGTVMAIMNMAREVGIKKVNVAERPL